jgi:transposase-like protein
MIWVNRDGSLYELASEAETDRVQASCPLCGGVRVYFSGWQSIRERLTRGRGLRPYRCHDCQSRFLDRVGLSCYGEPGEVMLVPPADKKPSVI